MGLWNLIKLALIGMAVWLLYRGVRSLMGGQQQRPRPRRRPGDDEVLDVMVQDPNCGTYLPQQQALRTYIKGREYYFCSEKCRDEFLAGSKEKH